MDGIYEAFADVAIIGGCGLAAYERTLSNRHEAGFTTVGCCWSQASRIISVAGFVRDSLSRLLGPEMRILGCSGPLILFVH